MKNIHILYGCILVLMLTGFVLQVKESIRKFFAKKTTTAITMASDRKLQLPAISFCPGFRTKNIKPARRMTDELGIVTYFDVHPNKSMVLTFTIIVLTFLHFQLM